MRRDFGIHWYDNFLALASGVFQSFFSSPLKVGVSTSFPPSFTDELVCSGSRPHVLFPSPWCHHSIKSRFQSFFDFPLHLTISHSWWLVCISWFSSVLVDFVQHWIVRPSSLSWANGHVTVWCLGGGVPASVILKCLLLFSTPVVSFLFKIYPKLLYWLNLIFPFLSLKMSVSLCLTTVEKKTSPCDPEWHRSVNMKFHNEHCLVLFRCLLRTRSPGLDGSSVDSKVTEKPLHSFGAHGIYV